jgi:hypothetical protein
LTPPRTFARYRAFTGSRGGIIPKGNRPHPRGASGTPPPTTTYELSRHRSRPRRLRHGIPRQMFHVEHLPDFFVGKTPFLSLLFVL